MKSIQHRSILFYYDGPQVIEASDPIGGNYIGVLVGSEIGEDMYLIAGVSPQRLRRFRVGSLDLRSLFVYRDVEQWWLGHFEDNGSIALQDGEGEIPEDGFLPAEGFYLRPPPSDSDVALVEARTRNNLVFEVSIEPREAHTEHKVRSQTLVGLLAILQGILKHAYGRSSPSAARSQNSNAHLFDVVVPAAAGSFKMVMEAAEPPDLFGVNDMHRAFEVLDVLFANVEDPEKAGDVIRNYRGHLAGAFLRLLKFLSEHDTSFRYSWALPDFRTPRNRAINRAETGPLLQVLERTSNLSVEIIEIRGVLDRGSRNGKNWKLIGEDQTYVGTVKRGGPSLIGLEIGARYVFRVQEEIIAIDGLGREKRSLYLLAHHPEESQAP